MRKGSAFVACAGLFVASLASSARASPSSRLVYSRGVDATSCPDEEALRKAVAARVGYDAFFPWAKRTVVVTMSGAGKGFVGGVELIDEDGIRHGEHPLRTQGACNDLLDTVALAVAIAIDPRLLAGPSVPAPLPPPPAPSPAPMPPPHPESPVPDTVVANPLPKLTDRFPVTLAASLGPSAGFGFAPAPSVGGTVGLEILWRRYSLGVEGFIAAPLSVAAKGGVSGSYDVWPTIATLAPCVHLWRFFGCGIAQVGALHVSATGVSGASPTWGALGGRVGVLWPLTERLSLKGRVDVVGDLSPPAISVESVPQGTTSPVATILGIDVVVRFP